MYLDRYDDLKEQCDICRGTGLATAGDCSACQRGAAIQDYEERASGPQSISVPVFSEDSDECGEFQITGYRREYV